MGIEPTQPGRTVTVPCVNCQDPGPHEPDPTATVPSLVCGNCGVSFFAASPDPPDPRATLDP